MEDSNPEDFVDQDDEGDDVEDENDDDSDNETSAQDLLDSIITEQVDAEQIKSLNSFCKKAKSFLEKNEGDDIVQDFLKLPGSCLKLANLINDRGVSPRKMTYVFKALHCILLRITGDLKQFEQIGHDTVLCLLQSGINTFDTLMSQRQHQERVKASLQLLTLMVLMGQNFAKSLASQFTTLTRNLCLLANSRAIQDFADIRTCVIHFVMSFLISDIHFIIRHICDQRDVLFAIISGLPYDKASSIQPFLTTFKSKVLENSKISKTQKIKILNEQTLSAAYSLLSWKGPKILVDRKLLKKSKRADEAWTLQDASADEVETVQTTAFEFLQVACASHKHGIIFHANQSQHGRNPNHTITSVLVAQQNLFEDWRKRELVAQILNACPDQAYYFLSQVKATFEPRNSEAWYQAMMFITRVASLQSVEDFLIQSNLQKDVSPVVRKIQISLGMLVLNKKNIFMALRSTDYIQKLMMTDWLIITLEKVQRIPSLQDRFPELNVQAICSELLSFLPSLSDVLPIFLDSGQSDIEISSNNLPDGVEITMKNYLNKMLDLLLLCCELYSTSLETASPGAFLKLLSMINSPEFNLDKSSLMVLQLKTLRLVGPDLTSTHLWSDKVETKSSPLYMLFDLFVQASERSTSDSARQLIFQIFSQYEDFEGYNWELEIWLLELHNLPTKTKKKVVKLLCHAVHSFFHNPNQYSDIVMDCRLNTLGKAIPNESVSMSMSNKEFLEFLEKNYRFNSDKENRTLGAFFTPLVPAVVDVLSQDATSQDFKGYFETVVLKILHRQQEPDSLCLLLNKSKDELSEFLRHYVCFWRSDIFESNRELHSTKLSWQKHLKTPDISKAEASVWSNLLTAFIYLNQKLDITEKELLAKVSVALNKTTPTSYAEAMDIFYQSLFYLQAQLKIAAVTQEENGVFVLCSYLDEIVTYLTTSLSDSSDKLNVIWKLLSNPIFKSWFLTPCDTEQSTLCQENLQKCSQLLTDFTCKYLNIATKLDCDMKKLSDIFSPFQSKLMTLVDIVFDGNIQTLQFMWPSIARGIVGCIDMVSLLQVANLLNKLLTTNVTTLLKLEDVADILQLLLKKYIEFNGKSEFQCLKTETVKTLVECVCSIHENQKNCDELKWCLSAFLQQNPVFSFVVTPECFEVFLMNGGLANLSIVKIVCKNNPALCSYVCKWVKQHVNDLVTWPSFLFLQITEIAFKFHLADLEKKNFPLNEFSNVYWKHLGALVAGEENSEDLFEGELGATPLLTALLLKGKIEKSSLGLITSKAVEESLNQPSISSLNTITVLSHIFKSIQSSCPSYKIKDHNPMTNLAKMHLHWVQIQLSTTNSSDLLLLDLASEALNIIQACDKTEISDALFHLNFWFQFVTNLLRKGLRCGMTGPILLNLLKELCQAIFTDSDKMASPTPVEILQLVLGHSAFSSFMVEEDSSLQALKEPVIDLWTTLAFLDSSCCQSDHFPVLLGSYRATLAPTDQKIFYLMSFYEEMGISMHGFRPFLWGPSAVSYYTAQASSRLSLWKQPKLDDILHLLEKEKLLKTSLKFPLDVAIKPTGNLILNSSGLPDDDFHSIHDARFLLLVLNHLVQPGSVVNCEQFMSSYCLAFVISTLSYQDDNLRALGYQVLNLFCQHLESRRSYQNKPWIFILEVLRNSLKTPNICLPTLITSFFVKALCVLFKPNDALFNVLSKFVILKPALDTENVPEFYELFYSSDIQHVHHRTWLFSLLNDGLRTSKDFHLFQKRFVFPILLSYCTSAICSVQHKVLILRILCSAVRIWSAALTLCRAQSLMAWIQCLITNHIPEKHADEILTEVVQILETLIKTSKIPNQKRILPKKDLEEDNVEGHTGEGQAGIDSEQENSVHKNEKNALENPLTDEMEVDNVQELPTSHMASFYSSFPNELLLVCLSLLDSVKGIKEPETLHRCLKICLDCFKYHLKTTLFLPYLNEEHLDFLLNCAHLSSNQKPAVNSFILKNDFSFDSCRETVAQIIMLIPPKLYIRSHHTNAVLEAVNLLLVSENVDFRFVESVCFWLTMCLKCSTEREQFVNLLVHEETSGSQCIGLLLLWMTECISNIEASSSVECLKSGMILFLQLICEKYEEAAEPSRRILESYNGLTTETNSAKMIELTSLISKIWLEGIACNKNLRTLQKFIVL